MENIVSFSIEFGLALVVLLLLLMSYRVVVANNLAERLQALDVTTTLIICAIILAGLALDNALFIDVGIALAALGFVATFAIARFISEGRVF